MIANELSERVTKELNALLQDYPLKDCVTELRCLPTSTIDEYAIGGLFHDSANEGGLRFCFNAVATQWFLAQPGNIKITFDDIAQKITTYLARPPRTVEPAQ